MGRDETRQRLIDAAGELFYDRGIHRTGIELILERAGLSKPTLYEHFASKDELVTAVIDRWRADREQQLTAILERSTPPRDRLLEVFRYYESWFRQERFRGCGLVKAAAELNEQGAAGRESIAAHKQWVIGRLERLARRAGARSPRALARALVMLIEGATVMEHAGDAPGSGRLARRTAATLIDHHLS